MTIKTFDKLIKDVRDCRECVPHLPMGPRPVVQLSKNAKILIAGQAPGRLVHETGIPFNDPSGNRLRDWLGVDKETFYDDQKIALLPMGFCFPGTGKSGDHPLRPECAKKWRPSLLSELNGIELTLIIGQYAINWHLGKERKKNLTETVRACEEYGPNKMVLPHPSPRNNIWMKKNPWFEKDVLPILKKRVNDILY
ncbi:MAG: uracil-DNA glycosylase family protein [Emcibacteraceae bacterium]|nr:uracil-DNA glycosylase family protein [Emcibacteraceae bacterium]MDG1996684.1 uracil-DNA glycosylase family protein [Emcibacteraceae bacterium]